MFPGSRNSHFNPGAWRLAPTTHMQCTSSPIVSRQHQGNVMRYTGFHWWTCNSQVSYCHENWLNRMMFGEQGCLLDSWKPQVGQQTSMFKSTVSMLLHKQSLHLFVSHFLLVGLLCFGLAVVLLSETTRPHCLSVRKCNCRYTAVRVSMKEVCPK